MCFSVSTNINILMSFQLLLIPMIFSHDAFGFFVNTFYHSNSWFLFVRNLTNFIIPFVFGSSRFNTITIFFQFIYISFSLLSSLLLSFLFILFLFLFLLLGKKQITFSVVFLNSPLKNDGRLIYTYLTK